MKFLFASDSFKGTLSSERITQLLEAAAEQTFPGCETAGVPVADGGEGTIDAVISALNGTYRRLTVHGPLMEEAQSFYGEFEGDSAIIEMAAASGLPMVPADRRNPLNTTTYGTGELIRDALDRGYRKISIAIGGSATNDGGIGMLQALGYGILDKEGRQVPYGARGLAEIASVTDDNVLPELSGCTFRIACDVTNPLCGEQGCSAVFGPQKGADPEMIRQMDGWLEHFAALSQEKYPAADPLRPGTGAAGGLGFAFLGFTKAVLESGVKIVLDETKLEDYVRDADLVITGEGRLDGQTVMGKAPIGVAKTAKKYGKPVIGFSGCVTKDAVACNREGIDAFFPILRGVVTLDEAMKTENAGANLADTAEQVFRLIRTMA